MNIREYRKKGTSVVEIVEDGVIIANSQNLLDIISDVSSKRIAVRRENICEDFFDLHTGLAGEILQKASNYRLCIGIIGDFRISRARAFATLCMNRTRDGR